VPFVSKTIGVPLASLAARVMLGETLEQLGYTEEIIAPYVSVKEAVFPFTKFREFDPVLGPEMRSTGEVMGVADAFGPAFAKAQLAAGNGLPPEGAVFVTVNDRDKPSVLPIARRFRELGFHIVGTEGTARYLTEHGVPSAMVHKVSVARPNAVDLIKNDAVQLLINTPLGKRALRDDETIRQAAIAHRVPYTTTLSAASAACDAIASLKRQTGDVRSMQEWQSMIARRVQSPEPIARSAATTGSR
jgi:carbamoyl-phosphate synthase large subunit